MSGSYASSRPPAPLTVAASLAAVQGMLILGYGIAQAASISGGNLAMSVTTALFFLVAGVFLLIASWGLTRRWTVMRGPVLVVQLFQLGFAWNLRSVPIAAIALVVYALVTLAGLLNPATTEYLDAE